MPSPTKNAAPIVEHQDISQFKKVIGGKDYIMVAGRVIMVHADHPDGPLSFHSEVLWNNEQSVAVRATVTTAKGEFTAHAESYKQSGTPIERKSPLEVAETSAYGRALAYAGYALEDGIASAEEVDNADGRSSDAIRPQVAVKASQESAQQPARAFGGPGGTSAPRPGPTQQEGSQNVQNTQSLRGWPAFKEAVSGKLNQIGAAIPLIQRVISAIEINLELKGERDDSERLREIWNIAKQWTTTQEVVAYLNEVVKRNDNIRRSRATGATGATGANEEKTTLEELFEEPQPDSVKRVQMPDFPEG